VIEHEEHDPGGVQQTQGSQEPLSLSRLARPPSSKHALSSARQGSVGEPASRGLAHEPRHALRVGQLPCAEAEDEFGEVAVQVDFADPVLRAVQAPLQLREVVLGRVAGHVAADVLGRSASWTSTYPHRMAPKPDPKRDEPVKIDLDPEDAFRALLKVDPDSEPVEDDEKD
jgi:hypothetical protein